MTVLAAGQAAAQEAPAQPPSITALEFRVLAESVVRNPDGGTVTFKRVEPPPAAVVRQKPVRTPSVAEAARIQRLDAKEQLTLCISATVHAGGLTVLRWSCGGQERLRAVSNVDFRHLAGLTLLETERTAYAIFMGLGVEAGDLPEAEVLAAKSLLAHGRASLKLLAGSEVTSKEDERAMAAMKALLAYYEAHRTELTAHHQQREAALAAQELPQRNESPPGPKNAVIHFWPLQPAQKAALTEKMLRERGAK